MREITIYFGLIEMMLWVDEENFIHEAYAYKSDIDKCWIGSEKKKFLKTTSRNPLFVYMNEEFICTYREKLNKLLDIELESKEENA